MLKLHLPNDQSSNFPNTWKYKVQFRTKDALQIRVAARDHLSYFRLPLLLLHKQKSQSSLKSTADNALRPNLLALSELKNRKASNLLQLREVHPKANTS